MPEQLFITLTGHALSGVILFIVAVVVFLHNPKRIINQLFAVMVMATALFEASFVLAPLMPTYELAYAVWMVNLVDVVIAVSVVHFVLEVLGEAKQFRWYIIGAYISGFLIVASSLLFPHLFLPTVEPKLYFPWYLDGGPLYWVMLAFFLIAPLFPIARMIRAYLQGRDRVRYEYYILMFLFAYTFGSLNFALVFDYPIDPVFGMFVGAAMIPIAYGIIADQLLDIRVIIKRAFVYSVVIAVIAGLFTGLILLNDLVIAAFPGVRFYMVPLVVALISVGIGRAFWVTQTENERLKYEFITIATHKLRTPLTQISWAFRLLFEMPLEPRARELLDKAQQSTSHLIELTDILFESAEAHTQEYAYVKEPLPLMHTTREVLKKLQPIIDQKKLRINVHTDDEVVITADRRRMTTVLEVILGNAVMYTPEGGLIQIITYQKGGRAFYSVRDSGIGIEPMHLRHVFSRFYRTDAAKRMDTEGAGLGLAIAKNIVQKHRGTIGVESDGPGKGSVFWFSLPVS